MIHSSRAGRVAAVVVLTLVVAAIAAASMRKQWKPSTQCLLCGSSEVDVSSLASASADPLPHGSSLAPLGAGRSTASSLGSTPVSHGPSGTAGSGRRASAGRQSWQPWGAGSGSFRRYVGNSNGPGSSLGGLWKLMGFARPGSTAASASAPVARAGRPERAASTPRQPRSAPPAAGPRPPAAAPAPPAPPAPTDQFTEHEVAVPNPFDQPPPGGPLDPGGPGGIGGGGGGGDDLSPNPEPASMLLLGTGLVGVFGALRRRRLI